MFEVFVLKVGVLFDEFLTNCPVRTITCQMGAWSIDIIDQ
jgi:hypothetical protein